MTTYTAIPNGDVDQDSPVTQTLMTLLRDNPIAIAEGATGAPKIELAAMAHQGAVGAVGTWASLQTTAAVDLNPGDTRAGSGLFYAPFDGGINGGTPLGTWRCMGVTDAGTNKRVTLFLRIA